VVAVGCCPYSGAELTDAAAGVHRRAWERGSVAAGGAGAALRGLLPVGVEVRNFLVRDLFRIVIEIARQQDVPGVGELAPRLRPCVFGLH
jgi:hypothetical protein